MSLQLHLCVFCCSETRPVDPRYRVLTPIDPAFEAAPATPPRTTFLQSKKQRHEASASAAKPKKLDYAVASERDGGESASASTVLSNATSVKSVEEEYAASLAKYSTPQGMQISVFYLSWLGRVCV